MYKFLHIFFCQFLSITTYYPFLFILLLPVLFYPRSVYVFPFSYSSLLLLFNFISVPFLLLTVCDPSNSFRFSSKLKCRWLIFLTFPILLLPFSDTLCFQAFLFVCFAQVPMTHIQNLVLHNTVFKNVFISCNGQIIVNKVIIYIPPWWKISKWSTTDWHVVSVNKKIVWTIWHYYSV